MPLGASLGLVLAMSSVASSGDTELTGFTSDEVAAQREWEETFRAIPQRANLREYMRVITEEPHIAGQPGSKKVAEYVLSKFESWGLDAWIERLKDPATRRRVAREMQSATDEWENLFLAAGTAENLLLVGFKNEELKPLTGKTLAEVAQSRGKTPHETAMDLVIEDGSRVGTVYFLMSEDNIRKKVALPWVSFGSDAGAPASEGVFLKSNPHPRAYGNFSRLLGKYVRQEEVLPLKEAIRKLTHLPATNLGIVDRGRLAEGYFADVVIFDPEAITDHSTFEAPHQYATGVLHVFVNGTQVVRDGEHSGAKPGRFVRRGVGRERTSD